MISTYQKLRIPMYPISDKLKSFILYSFYYASIMCRALVCSINLWMNLWTYYFNDVTNPYKLKSYYLGISVTTKFF